MKHAGSGSAFLMQEEVYRLPKKTVMKRHVQDFNAFSINEGFGHSDTGSASNADLLEVGIAYFEMTGQEEPESDSQIVRAAKRLLRGASPVPLTGNGNADIHAYIDHVGPLLGASGLALDPSSMSVDSDAFQNQVFVPFQGHPDLGITFNMDYQELVYQSDGGRISVPFSFSSMDRGDETTVSNPANGKLIMAAAAAFKAAHGI